MRSHSFIALTALLIAVATATTKIVFGSLTGAVTATADIGVEHDSPAILTMTIGRNAAGGGLVEMTHQSPKELWVSLPKSWELSEVRRGEVADLAQNEPSFGFVRYKLPPDVIAAFTATKIPDRLKLHNASPPSLSVRITTIDLPLKRVRQDVLLVKEQPTTIMLKFGRRE